MSSSSTTTTTTTPISTTSPNDVGNNNISSGKRRRKRALDATTTTTSKRRNGITLSELREIRALHANATCFSLGEEDLMNDTADTASIECIQGPKSTNSAVLFLPQENIQLLHVTQIMTSSRGGFWFWVTYAPLSALHHFNARYSPFLPNLPDAIGPNCNLYLTSNLLTSDFSVGTGSRNLYQALTLPQAATIATPKNRCHIRKCPIGRIGITITVSGGLRIATNKSVQLPRQVNLITRRKESTIYLCHEQSPQIAAMAQALIAYLRPLRRQSFQCICLVVMIMVLPLFRTFLHAAKDHHVDTTMHVRGNIL